MNPPQAFAAADAAFSLPLFRDRTPLSYPPSNDEGQTSTGKVLQASGASLAKVIKTEAPSQFNAIEGFFDALYLLEKGV